MDHSQVTGANGFGYDPSSWPQSMNVDHADTAFFFGGEESAPANQQQSYGAPSQAPAAYAQNHGHPGTYGSSYPSHGYDQYQQYPQTNGLARSTPLSNPQQHQQHQIPGSALQTGYPQVFDARHAISSVQQHGYAATRVASPYQLQQQPAVGQSMDGYGDPRPSNNGYNQQQNGAAHQSTAGLSHIQQPQYFNNVQAQQQVVPQAQQQQQVSTPQQQTANQLLYAQAQQQQAIQQQKQLQAQAQHAQAQQQRFTAQQQQHVPATAYPAQPVVQQRPAAQPVPQSSAARHMPPNTQSTTAHFATFAPQQQHHGLAVPDRLLRPIVAAVDPTNCDRWAGMHHAFVSDTPEDASAKFTNETLMPVFARTERRRLFKERPLLIPAEAMGRYMDSLKSIGSDDSKAGIKHRTRRLALEYDLKRVGGLDHDALETYDKVPKSGPSKFQAEARKRGFEYPPLASLESISDLDLLEMKTTAMLDLPTNWTPAAGLVEQVASDFVEHLGSVVKDLRSSPEYKELLNVIKASKVKGTGTPKEKERTNKLRAVNDKGRERVRRVVAAALHTADDRILAVLNTSRIAQPFQTVINLYNTGDINAPLTKALLEFAGRLPFLDQSLIEAFKWDKLLTKLEDGGDDDIKAAVRKIKDIVKSNEGKPPRYSKPASATATDGDVPSKAPPAKVNTAPSSNGSGAAKLSTGNSSVKRPRKDDEDGEGRVTKKPATGSSTSQAPTPQPNPQSAQTSSKPSALAQSQAKSSASSTILNALKARASTGALPGKSRPTAKATPKPETVKQERTDSDNKSLQPQTLTTSKTEVTKPSTNNTTTTTSSEPRKMPPTTKKEDIKPEPSRSGGSSSFAALMSEIEKPKAAKRRAPSPEKTEAPINETDEERERRLRKEKRRRLGLRVSFKSDAELTAVRIFHKEEAEDEERDNSMIRDANDDKAEGRLLKASRSSQLHADREWEEPVLVDFSTIPDEIREKTYTTRGGHIKVETEQMKISAEKEMKEVMVVYTDSADIPASASSPRPETETDFEPAGVELPTDTNIVARAALFMACGPRGAVDLLSKRRAAASTSTAAMLVNKVQAANPYQNFDDPQVRAANDEAVFKALTSPAARNYVDPEPPHIQLSKIRRDYSDPATQAASKAIESVVAQLAGLPASPQEPPKWQQDPARREEWINGYNADKRAEEAARQAAQQSALLNYNPPAPAGHNAAVPLDPYAQYYAQLQAAQAQAAGQHQQQHQPAAQDPMAALAALQQTAGQPAQAPADPLAALMSAFGGQQQQPQVPAGVDPNQALQLAMWAAASGAQPPNAAQFLNPPTAQGHDINNQRDEGEHRNRNRRTAKGSGGGGAGDEDHLRGINRSLIGTKPCTFWARGNCNRGDKCTFRHG